MTTILLNDLSAAQRQRLAYIEFRVWFFGEVTRKDVLDRFGLATAAGTRDMVLYREPTFTPLFEHQAERVLAMLTAGFGEGEPPSMGESLPHAVPARLNQPPLDILAAVTRAIHGGYPLRLTYHSMKTGAVAREIVPHALVDSGLRWHVRAYDRTKGEFRDLVLTRMENIEPLENQSTVNPVQSHELPAADAQWQKEINLDLLPHPAHPHPSSIARDFGMGALGALRVTLRAAVAGYVLRQWQVDCSPDARLREREFRLWLADTAQLNGVDNAVLAPGFVKGEA
jgi:predicted DNA-binding transcriptional regulator YafY